MPIDGRYGQLITFATEVDPDATYAAYIWIRAAHNGDTVRLIAMRRGHPELAREIAKLNGIRSVTKKLRRGRLLKIPGTLQPGLKFDVLPTENRPIIKDGYATYDIQARPGRVGITRFTGYNPIAMDVAIRFEEWIGQNGSLVESKIAILERMAGRGHFKGAATGPPAVVRVSCTDAHGNIVPLIPPAYQWSLSNPTAPLWRIVNIEWQDGALSNAKGQRVRAEATVHLWQYTPISLVSHSTPSGPKPIKITSQPVTVHR